MEESVRFLISKSPTQQRAISSTRMQNKRTKLSMLLQGWEGSSSSVTKTTQETGLSARLRTTILPPVLLG